MQSAADRGILLCMGLFSRFCVRAPRWTTRSASMTCVTALVEALRSAAARRPFRSGQG
jgi:hypothetical protein